MILLQHSGRMSEVRVFGFGDWTIEVDGARTGELRSRAGRELLLRMSLVSGSVTRERLIDELWPQQSDVRRGRRRLSQELNRVQETVGLRLWTSTNDSVEVSSSCRLWSDLSAISRGSQPDAALAGGEAERGRLIDLLLLSERGPLLPGHTSVLASMWCSQTERDEVRLLRKLLALLPEVGSGNGLTHARRWAQLEPFDDEAHVAVIRRLRLGHGIEAASDYAADVEQRYRQELGCAPSEVVRNALIDPRGPAKHALWVEIDELRDGLDRAGATGDVDHQRSLLFAIDDLLRIAGHNLRRCGGLDQLRHIGCDPVEVAWREADIAFMEGDVDRVGQIIDSRPSLDASVDSEAMLILAGCRRDEMVGKREEALAKVRQVLADAPSTAIRIESNLLLAQLLDRGQDFPAAERVLLQVCADADEIGCLHSRARALCDLGWVHIGAGHHSKARQILLLGQEQAEHLGAESVEASACGGLGHLLASEHRFGSSLAKLLWAADISERIGDVSNRMRWQANAAVAALVIGDVTTAETLYDAVTKTSATKPEAEPFWLEAVACNILEQRGQMQESAERTTKAIENVQGSGIYGYELTLRIDLVRRLIHLDRIAESLAAAATVSDLVTKQGMSETGGASADAMTGSALTAANDPAAGIVHLRRAAAASLTRHTHPFELHYWHYTAATMLGEHDEARGVAASAEQYALALRSDLTVDQWATAVANAPGMRQMTNLYESRSTS